MIRTAKNAESGRIILRVSGSTLRTALYFGQSRVLGAMAPCLQSLLFWLGFAWLHGPGGYCVAFSHYVCISKPNFG